MHIGSNVIDPLELFITSKPEAIKLEKSSSSSIFTLFFLAGLSKFQKLNNKR